MLIVIIYFLLAAGFLPGIFVLLCSWVNYETITVDDLSMYEMLAILLFSIFIAALWLPAIIFILGVFLYVKAKGIRY